MGVDVEMFQNKFLCTYSGQALYKIGKVAFALALGSLALWQQKYMYRLNFVVSVGHFFHLLNLYVVYF